MSRLYYGNYFKYYKIITKIIYQKWRKLSSFKAVEVRITTEKIYFMVVIVEYGRV